MKLKKIFKFLFFSIIALLLCTSCQHHSTENTLKIAATTTPQSEMLEVIKDDLKASGINLEIVTVDDYNIPNRLLAEKEVDANFFQHIPFLEDQKKRFGYDLEVLEKIHLEPLGLYSKKWKSINELKDKAIIAIPNDPTNEARALNLLEKNGLIKLKPNIGLVATPLDIVSNPLNLQLKELDAAFLTRAIKDVDAAVIPANFAILAGFSPTKEALILESAADSPYANVVVVRRESLGDKKFDILKKSLTSAKMYNYILERFNGGITPAFAPNS